MTRLVLVLTNWEDRITVYDANTLIGNPLMTTLTNVVGSNGIACAAVDEDDDIWAIVKREDLP